VAERALQLGIRPVLTPSRPDVDPAERLAFGDTPMFTLNPGSAHVRDAGQVIYLAMAVRNVGAGLAVIHGWHVEARSERRQSQPNLPIEHAETDDFRPQHRDLYISADDTGFWQGALRDPHEGTFAEVQQAIAARRPVDVQLLYGDHEGGQHTISLFGLATEDEDGDEWLCAVVRHWSVDAEDPR
jgi:hypothetical protein